MWFDVPLARYAMNIAHIDKVALTKLDVLGKLAGEKIKICIGHRYKGKIFRLPPDDRFEFDRVEPVYIEKNAWHEDISDIREFNDLPQQAKDYVKTLIDEVGFEIDVISVGPEADQIIVMN
jgi:adenylosuccinate synthase